MAQGSSGAALITASLILGGSVVSAGYFLATAIDRGAGEVAVLSASLNSAVETAKTVAQAAAKPSAPTPGRRPDPNKVYKVAVGSAPTQGPKSAPITIVEWADFQ